MLKENAPYKCLSLIMPDSVIRVNKRYYSQKRLEESKYKIKKKKMEGLINYDLSQVPLMNLTMDLIMNLAMMNLMINLLKVKTAL